MLSGLEGHRAITWPVGSTQQENQSDYNTSTSFLKVPLTVDLRRLSCIHLEFLVWSISGYRTHGTKLTQTEISEFWFPKLCLYSMCVHFVCTCVHSLCVCTCVHSVCACVCTYKCVAYKHVLLWFLWSCRGSGLGQQALHWVGTRVWWGSGFLWVLPESEEGTLPRRPGSWPFHLPYHLATQHTQSQ